MKVTFNINFHTVWGQQLCISGSIPELGAWETAFAREMIHTGEGNWQLILELPDLIQTIEYRYILKSDNKQILEEWEKNHWVTLDNPAQEYTLFDYWQTRPTNLAFYSSAFTKSLFSHPCNTYERAVRSGKKLVIKILAPRLCPDQLLAISGNQSCLGNWNPAQALVLSCDTFPEWHIDLDTEEIRYPLEFKFLIIDREDHHPVYWEAGENRSLTLPECKPNENILVSGMRFRDELSEWRCAGSVIPLFSLRTRKSFGVGDLSDLHMLVDWTNLTNQRFIQLLPVNDTTMTYTWGDSYPYSTISIYALHPIYISLHWLGELQDKDKREFFNRKQQELNEPSLLDYEEVVKHKTGYCRLWFEQEKERILQDPDFHTFIEENLYWLVPYATFCYLRDQYGTADFRQWGEHRVYNRSYAYMTCDRDNGAWPEISFIYFLQYTLHTQFEKVSDYARKKGVVLKGDLPIGINRMSVEAWVEPNCFNMDGQAGAPPDDFSETGQNWGFPTYNWSLMEQDGFAWWKKRFSKLADYFDCFRIDHILGFFRIWEIPFDYVEGLCGHFNPALPLSVEEIEHYGFSFEEKLHTIPGIKGIYLQEIFGELRDRVIEKYLDNKGDEIYYLKSICDTQRKIEAIFEGDTDKDSYIIRKGLMAIANEVLFLYDPYEIDKLHPRISAGNSYAYKELNNTDKHAFDQLYWDFFYQRHNDFWKEQALRRLAPLVNSTQMLVCGEDLGMIPQTVPEVMNKLQILTLEIERMPKTSQREFADLSHLPYLSVCTTSTHDMDPLRNWWKENKVKTQRYYNEVLQREGVAPEDLTSELAAQIIHNHLHSHSMLVILPLQDWFAIDDSIRNPDIESERINVPANPRHYWRYRMHLPIEDLLTANEFNDKIRSLILKSGRK